MLHHHPIPGSGALALLSRKVQPRDTKMFSKAKIALSVAVVLITAFPTWAATKHHHRVTHCIRRFIT
jgi:hypothetical protein